MDGSHLSQRRDFGGAVADFTQGCMNGLRDFFEWVSSPFDQCAGLGNRRTEGMDHDRNACDDDDDDDDDSGIPKPVSEPAIVVASSTSGGCNEKSSTRSLLTAEALGSLDTSLGPLQRHGKSFSSNRTSSTLSITSTNSNSGSSRSGSSSSSSSRSGNGCAGCAAGKRTTRRLKVRFSHEVSVVTEWADHLAEHDLDTNGRGRDRASTMIEGDDFWSLLEANQNEDGGQEQEEEKPVVRRRVVAAPPPPRVLSRAAIFALEEDEAGFNASRKLGKVVGADGRRGGHALAYGRMRDIVALGRASSSVGHGREGLGYGDCVDDDVNDDDDDESDDDESDDEGRWCDSLFDSYDGSLASMRNLAFPATYADLKSTPVKRLFDDAELASSSRARWMTPAELDDILRHTNGWKNGTGGGARRRRRECANKREKAGFCDEKLPREVGTCGREDEEEEEELLCYVSVDNTVLKEELFGLAMEEGRTSVLFKRAFLNWERSSK